MKILNELSKLFSFIDEKTILLYKNKIDESTNYVNNYINQRADLSILIGLNSFELVKMNHKNHSNFMYNIFLTKDVKSMHNTYIWAYKTYYNKGFAFSYFYLELISWRDSFKVYSNEILDPIVDLYDYLITLHDYFVQQALSKSIDNPIVLNTDVYNRFLNSLLQANLSEALLIANEFIKTDNDIKVFFESIILPSLYTVGNKWANADISVGEEHSATSICQRVMSNYYPRIIKHINKKQKILVTTSPNELHEVGARMLSDMLELNGYDVTFLASNTTIQEKLETIEEEDIDYIIISTTMVSNIVKTKEIVSKIKEKFKLNSPKIIIGGQAYLTDNNTNNFIEADYLLHNVDELLNILKETEND